MTPPPAPSPRLSGQGLLAAAGVVAGVTLAARAAGLARWVVFSEAVGATCVGQVYATANTVPNVLFEIAAGGALAAVVVPLVARHLNLGDERLADRTASALLTWTLTLLLPLAVLVAVLAGPIMGLLMSTGDGVGERCEPEAAREAGRAMLLLFAPQVVLYGVGIVLAGVLQSHRRFLAAALAPLLSSVVVIGVYLVFGALYDPSVPLPDLSASAVLLLAGGTTLGVVALSLPLLWPVRALGVRWTPTWRFPEGTGRLAGALALAGLAAVGAQQLSVVVVLLLTNATGVGGITVWTYAQTAYLLPYAVLVVPLAVVAFPSMTGPEEQARPVLRRATTGALVAAVTGAAALVALRREVGAFFLALDAGADGPGRVALEALPATLAWLAPGLVGFALVAVLTRALYAARRPGRAAAAAALGWGVAGLLPLLTVGADAGIGRVLVTLAVGSSAGMTVAGAVLVAEVLRSWGREALAGSARGGLAALAGGLVALLVRELALPAEVIGMAEALGWSVVTGLLVLVCCALGVRLLGGPAWAAVARQVGARTRSR